MRPLLPAVVLVNVLSAHAVVICNREHPGDVHLPGQDLLKAIQPLLDGPGYALCSDITHANASDILYFESQHYTFQIDRQKHTDTVENCKAALKSIVNQCVDNEKVLGGDAFINDIGYEIYHTDLRERSDPELDGWLSEIEQWSALNDGDDDEEASDEGRSESEDDDDDDDVVDDDDDEEEEGEGEEEDGLHGEQKRRDVSENREFELLELEQGELDPRSLEARRGGRGGGRRARPRPNRKRPARKKQPKKKPTKKPTKKPASCPNDKKTKPGQKAKPGQVQPRAPGGKKSGGKGKPGNANGSCQQEQKLNCRLIAKKARAKNARENARYNLLARDEPEGFVDSMVNTLTKRGSKTGTACGGVKFNARGYPNNLPTNAHVYGWAHPLQCDNMEWGGSHNNFRKVSRAQGGEYEVEHILEWQTVTRFFEWLNDHHFQKAQRFPDPDPANAGTQLDFCQYWEKTWSTQTFTINVNGRSRIDAKKHIAWRYPGVGFKNEFVWLQKDINKPAKQNMWAYKGTNQVYDLPKALRAIRRNINDAAVEAFNVKALLGAQKYMKNPIIKQFFIDQKQRIGVALDEVDRALPNYPPATGHTAWQQQGLLNLWDTYMDQAFAEAVSRTERTMDQMLNALEARWIRSHPAQNPLKAQIKKLRTQWRWEKRSGWHQPNW